MPKLSVKRLKIVFIYLAIALFLASVIISFAVISVFDKIIFKSAKATVNSSIVETDNAIKKMHIDISSLCARMAMDTDIWLMLNYENGISTEDRFKINTKISNFAAPLDFVDSIYIYNGKNNTILYRGGLYPVSQCPEVGMTNLLKSNTKIDLNGPITRMEKIYNPSNPNLDGYSFFVSYVFNTIAESDTPQSSIIINIKTSWLQELAEDQYSKNKVDIIFSDKENRVLNVYDDYYAFDDISDLIGSTMQQLKKSNFAIVHGIRALSILSQNDLTGFKTLAFIPKSEVDIQTIPVKFVIVLSFAVIFLIYICLVLYFYSKTKKSLNMINEIASQNLSNKLIDVYIAQKDFIKNITYSLPGLTQEQYEMRKDELNIKLSYSEKLAGFIIALNKDKSLTENENTLFSRVICQIIENTILQSYQNFFVFEYEPYIYVALINCDDPLDIEELAKRAKEKTKEYAEGPASVFVLDKLYTINQLREFFADYSELNKRIYIEGENCVLKFSELVRFNFVKQYEYPEQEVKQFILTVMSNKIEESIKLYKSLSDEAASYYISAIKVFHTHIVASICSALEKVIINSEFSSLNILDFADCVLEAKTKHEADLIIINVIYDIGRILTENQKNRYGKIADEAVAIIINQLSDINLSQTSISGKIGYSTNYVNQFFKDKFKISITEFITEKRLELACRLLEETDYTIDYIAKECGIANKNYFYTLFKKKHNMTMKQYREKFKNRKGRDGHEGN